MASQIITTAVSTPVTITDDTIIVGETGSISSNGLGTALTLNGAFTAAIDGDIYVIDGIGIQANNPSALGSLQINETARVTSISEYSYGSLVEGIAVALSGTGSSLYNSGYIEGTNAGVMANYPDSDFTVVNSGQILGDIAIFYSFVPYTNTVENLDDGIIEGNTYGIYATNQSYTLEVDNAGTIIGNLVDVWNGAAIYTPGALDLTNTGTIIGGVHAGSTTDGSQLENTGEILAGNAPLAVSLGGGADTFNNTGMIEGHVSLGGGADEVRNEGTIDGIIALGGGRDRFLGGDGDETVFGGAGKDIIWSQAGDDIITGGRGNDLISAGAGEDVLIFAVGDGKDRIFNFEPGTDVVDLRDHDFDNLGDLLSSVTEYDDKLVVDLNGSDRLVFMDVQLSDLSAEDVMI